jgi:hypothetical protein
MLDQFQTMQYQVRYGRMIMNDMSKFEEMWNEVILACFDTLHVDHLESHGFCLIYCCQVM